MLQEFVQQIKDTVREELCDTHTAMPGEIVSVDYDNGLATVLPSMMFVLPNGERVAYPQITGVPLVFPQGNKQGESVVFPVKMGDSCLILVAEQSIDYWMYNRETDTDLKFDLTNAICIPGLFRAAPSTFKEACESNAVIISAGSTRLKVAPSGVTVDGKLTVTGGIVDQSR